MLRRRLLVPAAALALVVTACGDDDSDASGDTTTTIETTTTAADDATTSTSADDVSAVGDEGDELVAVSTVARVTGPFGEDDITLDLTENTSCTIRELDGEAQIEVIGTTTGGDQFSVDAARLANGETAATLVAGGTVWTAGQGDGEAGEAPTVRLARDGEAVITATFANDAGKTREAELRVNCLPNSPDQG